MENPVKTIYKSSRMVLKEKKYFSIFLVSALAFVLLFILLPVFLVPGNSLSFQLGVFTFWNYVLMFSLSALIGLTIALQVYSYKIKSAGKNYGKGILSAFSGFTAGIFGTAACSSCIAAVFGFLGLGGVFFLVKYQWYVVSISIVLVLISVYLTARAVDKGCEVCK